MAAAKHLDITGSHFNRAALVNTLAERFYIDQPSVLVSNNLSTELLVFPSDLDPSHRHVLNRRIANVIAYASAFRDVEALNALLHASTKERSGILALGLYLYFADECSRLNPHITFLTAMRQAGASLKANEALQPEQLMDKIKHAFALMHFGPEQEKVLREWHESGTYTINRNIHYWNGDQVEGAYAKLASDILKRQDYLGMNMAISYALGNKPVASALTPAQAYAMTENLSQSHSKHIVDERIRIGDEIRKRRIRDKIKAVTFEPAAFSRTVFETAEAKAIISYLPEPAVEILLREGYTIAYANSRDIRPCFPKANVPGLTPDENEAARESVGLSQKRLGTLFISNGNGRFSGDLEGDSVRYTVVAQSLLHETMHIITGYLNRDECAALKAAAEKLHEELSQKSNQLSPEFTKKLLTFKRDSLSTVADYQSPIYDGYSALQDAAGVKIRSDTRWEEVVCNLFGLLHSEYSGSKRRGFDQCKQEVAALKTLAILIEEAIDKAMQRCRRKFPQILSGKEILSR